MKHNRLFKRLDKTYQLVYVDYNSSLDGDEKEIQECIRTNEYQPLEEHLWEWEVECSDSSIDYAIEELGKELSDLDGRYGFSVEEYLQLHWEDIREEIENRDNSNTIHDLMRNTRGFVAFYSTGWSCGETCFIDDEGYKELKRDIRKELGLKRGQFDRELNSLICNASYGGELVIYFTIDDLNDWIGGDENTITFKSPHIALIDTCNGSGFDVKLPVHVFSLPFSRENVYLDKTIKYNYTYEVCGMGGDWCDDTGVQLSKTKLRKVAGQSAIGARQKEDDRLAAKFKAGSCTPMDMDQSRHKRGDLIYINDFPCGTHCKSCGTFWID